MTLLEVGQPLERVGLDALYCLDLLLGTRQPVLRLQPGPAAVWMRMRVPLVAGEEPTQLTRVLVAADSADGISWELPFGEYLFVNTELSVHLVRMAAGRWVCLDARTRIAPDGVGLAESVLWDERGRIGAGAQSLLVAPGGA